MDNNIVLCLFLLCLLPILLLICRQRLSLKLRDEKILGRTILSRVSAYVLLVNKDFEVELSNYSVKDDPFDPKNLVKIGNLLYCKNGVDAGICGKSAKCGECGVRNSLTKSFESHEDFEHVIEEMHLYSDAKALNEIRNIIFDVSGKFIVLNKKSYVLLTLVDKTIEYKQKNELRCERNKAEEANKYKTSFLATMSHEIRTPLNAIVGFAELLGTEEDADVRKEYSDIIMTNSEMLTNIISEVLDITKIESGAFEFGYYSTDLNKMISEIIRIFKSRYDEKKLELNFKIPKETYKLVTDEKRVKQVISNFLSNAVKNTEKGSVTCGYDVKEKDVYFYVSDTGVGISEENKSKIFQRFTQLNPSVDGNGLGLNICKSIVEGMGGKIGFDSKWGEGTTFWFYLPKK